MAPATATIILSVSCGRYYDRTGHWITYAQLSHNRAIKLWKNGLNACGAEPLSLQRRLLHVRKGNEWVVDASETIFGVTFFVGSHKSVCWYVFVCFIIVFWTKRIGVSDHSSVTLRNQDFYASGTHSIISFPSINCWVDMSKTGKATRNYINGTFY